MGWAEIAVIGVVALLVFGPDKLPGMAKQAGQLVRTVRQMAENAKSDLGREMGQDFSNLDLRDLDPREVVRRNLPHLVKALDDDVLPILQNLGTVAPDIHDMLEVVQDLNEMLAKIPGMGMIRRRDDD